MAEANEEDVRRREAVEERRSEASSLREAMVVVVLGFGLWREKEMRVP